MKILRKMNIRFQYELWKMISLLLGPIVLTKKGKPRQILNQQLNPIRNLFIFAFWEAWEIYDWYLIQ